MSDLSVSRARQPRRRGGVPGQVPANRSSGGPASPDPRARPYAGPRAAAWVPVDLGPVCSVCSGPRGPFDPQRGRCPACAQAVRGPVIALERFNAAPAADQV